MARHQRKTELVMQYPALGEIIGESQHIVDVCEQIIRYAPSTLSVLITGDIGSGKGLVARVLHACSPRHRQPFIDVNCASIPVNLFESELFGHRKGLLPALMLIARDSSTRQTAAPYSWMRSVNCSSSCREKSWAFWMTSNSFVWEIPGAGLLMCASSRRQTGT
jgi:Sigma-54 interaction domain